MPARILPSVLLPAPFSPRSAWQPARSTWKPTRSSASTPGKRLVISLKTRKDTFSHCSQREFLAQPLWPIGSDAVHIRRDESPRPGNRVNRPHVNLQAGGFELVDEPGIHRAARVQVHAVESSLSSGGNHLVGSGEPASGLPTAPEADDPANLQLEHLGLKPSHRLPREADCDERRGTPEGSSGDAHQFRD